MRLAAFVLGLALMASTTAVYGQAPATPPQPTTVEAFPANESDPESFNRIITGVRQALGLGVDITPTYVPGEYSLIVRGTAEQIALVRKILSVIERPRNSYRLTYTVTDSEDGKQIGSRHFSMIVVAGQRTTMKQGSKVPVLTGSYDAEKSAAQTQFTYLDVGLNVDVTLDELPTGLRIKSKAEQSSIAEEKSSVGAGDPIVRQTVLEGIATLTPGKPLIISSLDIPGSTRHTDLTVVAELVK